MILTDDVRAFMEFTSLILSDLLSPLAVVLDEEEEASLDLSLGLLDLLLNLI